MSEVRARTQLVGRARERELLRALVVGDTPAVLLRGDPGIGKTALVRWARDLARDEHGLVTLSAEGVPTETEIPFAGLHQLLVSGVREEPAAPWRVRVLDALRSPEAAGAALFDTVVRVLDALAELSSEQPLLITVDDVHWIDRATCEVLLFAVRRLPSDQVRLLVAGRPEVPAVIAQAALGPGWRTVELDTLDDAEAEELLARVVPGLAELDRRRVLAEAEGNPLALQELPKVPAAAFSEVPHLRPMTPRLEAAFASRIAQLPERTRDLVVLAALHHDGAVPEVLAAGEALTGEPVTLGDLDPAVEVGIVEVARARVRFGHPLVRSAVHQHVSPALRQHAHLVLARCASTRHEQVWHRAAAADEPDEDLARELDSLSVSAQDRHALEAAVRARVEAVRLSEEPGERARRQLGLVDLYVDLGQQDRARATLGAVDPAVLTPPERIWLAWVTDQLTASAWGGRDRLLEIARTARELHDIGDPRALPVLLSALLQCWWSNPTPRTRSAMAETADVVVPAGPGGSNLMHAAVTALAAPTQRGAAVLTAYAAAEPGALPTEAELLLTLALGASGVGDHVRAAAIFQASVRASRREGRFANLGQSLVGAAWSELHLGRVRRCAVLSDESLRLGRDLFQPLWQATALLARGAARALSGEVDVARADSDRAEQLIVEVGANPVLAQVRAVRGLAALGEGRYGDAYAQLRGVFDPRDVAHQENFRTFLVAELAEAAHGCGQQEEARDLLADVEAAWAGVPSPILRAGLLVARPLLAGGPRVEQHFRAALDDGLASWPMHRARVHLRYGAWLRRERRVGEARAHLREAHETFAALGAAPWADLASQELRAAGELPPVRTSAAWEHLTAQELQIALLAAEGFTNRQIGERLFLSHRTVGSHLYHIYPKLGIASRVQLASALAGVETDRPAPPDRAQAGTIS